MTFSKNREELQKLLDYNPETGFFYWVLPTKGVDRSVPAGSMDKDGYISIYVAGKNYYAHKLAWLFMTGEWPVADIDHVNGFKHQNKFSNLREATRSQNNYNANKRIDNKTGFKGVSLHNQTGKFRATIKVAGKQKHLGLFTTAEAAAEVRNKAAAELYGEFFKK